MVEHVLEKLCEKFDAGQARYRVVHHPAGDRSSASVCEVRGTELGQGAKALVCMAKGGGVKQYVLAVLPADQQADLKKLAHALGANRAGLCSPDEVMDLTGCILGAVPPVSFDERLLAVADPTLFTRYEEIAFNAGARDVSIIINTEDFRRIVAPREIDFLKVEQSA
ncbi:MAG: YbaK/EbsC family protein [Duodenibacillus sp.]|nr:YbaK/EbsC family protein [Duodenibacillus sp.]